MSDGDVLMSTLFKFRFAKVPRVDYEQDQFFVQSASGSSEWHEELAVSFASRCFKHNLGSHLTFTAEVYEFKAKRVLPGIGGPSPPYGLPSSPRSSTTIGRAGTTTVGPTR